MAKRTVGAPISVQEHRETLSATVDVESGATDFIIKRTLVNADNSDEIICVQTLIMHSKQNAYIFPQTCVVALYVCVRTCVLYVYAHTSQHFFS